MKLHGKGKIFFRQNIHIYSRISWNLEDEIFPKGVGVVTPKILFGLFKISIWLEGGVLNFSSKEPPFQNIFFMARVLFGFTQGLILVLEVLSFYLDSNQNAFHLGKMPFENLFENALWLLEKTLYHFQQIPLTMTLVQIHSPKPSLTFGSWFASNPASWTSPCDHFHSNSIQINFCLLF